MKVLVCNVGSTSLKFKMFEMPNETLIAEARIERVGSTSEAIYYYLNAISKAEVIKEGVSIPDYTAGIRMFLDGALDCKTGVIASIDEIEAIGFKTVLAKKYGGIHELNEDVLRAMEEYLFVAPAHNGPYLEAIRMFKKMLPDTLLVGVFETAFHTTIPIERRMYALPYEWYEKYGIQRMGYHGASHEYVAQRIAALEGANCRVVSCHLGGSSSLCAILDGKSVDTSFGFSLQTGIPHACRSGDMDAYVIPYLLNEGLELEEILTGLSEKSGLLGISGISGDLRPIEAAAKNGDERAQLSLEIFVCSIVKYIGSFYAVLGGLDCLVFTGGIGEKSTLVREMICSRIAHMGIILDDNASGDEQGERIISSNEALVKAYVIPANEEIVVARKTFEFSREKGN